MKSVWWDMGISMRWYGKHLQRNGILASRRVESDFYIETGDMTTNGYIIHPVAGRTIKVDTIEELLEQVTAILASV